MTHGIGWRNDFAVNNIVSDVKHTAEECLITGNTFSLEGFTTIGHGFGLNDKTTFGTHWDNHRVFDHLCFDQTEYFGTEIFHTVRPAQTATRYFAAAQMYRFHTWRIDKYLKHRFRFG